MNEVYSILEFIKELGIIRTYYEIYCRDCKKSTGIAFFETINQIPEYVECDECFEALDPINDSIVVYRVMSDE